jgi:hypothetical protein
MCKQNRLVIDNRVSPLQWCEHHQHYNNNLARESIWGATTTRVVGECLTKEGKVAILHLALIRIYSAMGVIYSSMSALDGIQGLGVLVFSPPPITLKSKMLGAIMQSTKNSHFSIPWFLSATPWWSFI